MKRPSQARLLQVQHQAKYPQPQNMKEKKPRAVLVVCVCPRMRSWSKRSRISRSFHPSMNSSSHTSFPPLSMSTSTFPTVPTSFCPCTRSCKNKCSRLVRLQGYKLARRSSFSCSLALAISLAPSRPHCPCLSQEENPLVNLFGAATSVS